jgi:hypothetical protein
VPRNVSNTPENARSSLEKSRDGERDRYLAAYLDGFRAGLESASDERKPPAPRDPVKTRARALVNGAIRRGELVRGPCEVGAECEGRIEAHHEDYAAPLAVRWLCVKHHNEVDRPQRPVASRARSLGGAAT